MLMTGDFLFLDPPLSFFLILLRLPVFSKWGLEILFRGKMRFFHKKSFVKKYKIFCVRFGITKLVVYSS
jgi:hypothetical protein